MSVFHEKPITHINHVAIKVAQLERSLLFYKNILGMQVLSETPEQVELTADGVTPLVTLVEIENAVIPSMRTIGLYHFAILLPTRTDLAHFLQHIMDKNIPFGASDHHVSEAIYLEDPDGNGIEVYADRPSESWAWIHEQVTMVTERINAPELLKLKTKNWNVIPSDTVLGHLHLHVDDLESAKVFFEALGFSVVSEFHGAVFMSAGKYHHHIACNIWNGPDAVSPANNFVGLQSFSVTYNDNTVRNRTIERLEKLSVKVTDDNEFPSIRNSPYGDILLTV